MKKLLACSIFLLSCSAAVAYEKIEFKGQITNPAFVKISAVSTAEGRVFVADSKANAVFIFDSEGKLLNKTRALLAAPAGLSFGNGKIFVAESGASKITVLDGEGAVLWSFSGPGSAPGGRRQEMHQALSLTLCWRRGAARCHTRLHGRTRTPALHLTGDKARAPDGTA